MKAPYRRRFSAIDPAGRRLDEGKSAVPRYYPVLIIEMAMSILGMGFR